ncbi:unnamed protein product, partial [Prorocentrum cordatum]
MAARAAESLLDVMALGGMGDAPSWRRLAQLLGAKTIGAWADKERARSVVAQETQWCHANQYGRCKSQADLYQLCTDAGGELSGIWSCLGTANKCKLPLLCAGPPPGNWELARFQVAMGGGHVALLMAA